MDELKQNPKGNQKTWVQSHLSSIVVFGVVMILILMQWPLLKGVFYRATGMGATDQISWRADYPTALDEAGVSGKPLLLVFGAIWCPPCQVMKHEVWPDKRVEQIANEKFIPVYIDGDTQERIMAKFGVMYYPTIIAASSAGEPLSQVGISSASEMVAFLNHSLQNRADLAP